MPRINMLFTSQPWSAWRSVKETGRAHLRAAPWDARPCAVTSHQWDKTNSQEAKLGSQILQHHFCTPRNKRLCLAAPHLQSMQKASSLYPVTAFSEKDREPKWRWHSGLVIVTISWEMGNCWLPSCQRQGSIALNPSSWSLSLLCTVETPTSTEMRMGSSHICVPNTRAVQWVSLLPLPATLRNN